MIASALRNQIARYAAEMPISNPLFYLASDGALTHAQIAHYLVNIRHLVGHTVPHLNRAEARAAATGQPRLAAHYASKIVEEEGHELWAERDMERVRGSVPGGAPGEIVAAMHEYIAFIERIIDEDPALYLAYILFAEYLIVLLGPQWLLLLEEQCGVPRTSMTVIANHAELDRAHAEEAFECIDELVRDPRKLPRLREVLTDSIRIFSRFCEEITGTKGIVGHASDRRHAAQQPAA